MSGPHLKHYIAASGRMNTYDEDKYTHIKISVYYSKGGTNFYTYKQEPGAIWASISPVMRKGDGIETCILGKGIKCILEPATRLNRKNVEAAFQRAVAEVTMGTGQVWDVVQKVCVQENVSLVASDLAVNTILTDVHATEAPKS